MWYSCQAHESDRALIHLSQHDTLKLLGGNPQRIFQYVQYLSKDVSVSQLPALIRADERRKLEAELTRAVSEESGREVWRSVALQWAAQHLHQPLPTASHKVRVPVCVRKEWCRCDVSC